MEKTNNIPKENTCVESCPIAGHRPLCSYRECQAELEKDNRESCRKALAPLMKRDNPNYKRMDKKFSPEQFERLADEFIKKEIEIMNWKAGEYSGGTDRIQNFRQIATLMDTTPANIALTYLLKHIQSIMLAVQNDRIDWCWEGEGGEGTKQRICDSRNYLLLLAACIADSLEDSSDTSEGTSE